MVKPNVHKEQATDLSQTANSHIGELGIHIPDGKTQWSQGKCGRKPDTKNDDELFLEQGLYKQSQNGLQKNGGTGEVHQEQDVLDKTQTEMLVGTFNNIRDSHGRKKIAEHFGVSLHDYQGSETTHGSKPPSVPKGLEAYNIHTADSNFIEQLVDQRNRCHIPREPPSLGKAKFQVHVLKYLGKGSEAECFLCEDVYTKKRIVQKQYYGKPRERERVALETLRHRSIPAFYGTAVEDGHHVLRMEYCGKSLRHWKNHKQLAEPLIWEIFEQLTDVLSYLDNHHVIHLDIKPDNVCIQTASTGLITKLIDFGSVHTAQDKVGQDGRITAAYMAPEMWLYCIFSALPVSSKSDVFACALTICYLVYDVDLVPHALSTTDLKQMCTKMITNPSLVADYVTKTFPLDMYSQTLMNLLLKMLDGRPDRRISAADAHKEIVTHRKQPVYQTLDVEQIREKLGIDIVNHTVPLNNFNTLTTPSFQETVQAIESCYKQPNLVTSQQGGANFLLNGETVDGRCQTFSDIALGLPTGDVAAPRHVTGLTLATPTGQQANGTLTTSTFAINNVVNQHSFINGSVETNHQPTSAHTDDSQYSYLQGLEEHVSELSHVKIDTRITMSPEILNQEHPQLVPENRDAGVPAVLESRPQILNQEHPELVLVNYDAGVPAKPESRPQILNQEHLHLVPENCDAGVPAVFESRPQILNQEHPQLAPENRDAGVPAVLESRPQILNQEHPELVLVNDDAGVPAVLESRPQILNQEHPHLVPENRDAMVPAVLESRPQILNQEHPYLVPENRDAGVPAVLESRPQILNQEHPQLTPENRDAGVPAEPESRPQILNKEHSEWVPENRDAGVPAEPEIRPQILNQEQQDFRNRSTENTIVSNRAGEPNLTLGSDPPAKQETIDKLKDRLKTGIRKRALPVLPSKYTNIPHLDLIDPKMKRRKTEV